MADDAQWTPARSIEEVSAIMTAPGGLHEMELAVIDDRVYRVYKNMPSVSLRAYLPTRLAHSLTAESQIAMAHDPGNVGQQALHHL